MQRSDFRFFFPMEVRWGDMDAFEHVNNVQFIRYLESGRLAYLEHLEKTPGNSPITNKSVLLADVQCSFLRQLGYPASIEVGVRVAEMGNSSFRIMSAIFHTGEDAPVATSRSVLVWFDLTSQKTRPIPTAVRDAVTAFEAKGSL